MDTISLKKIFYSPAEYRVFSAGFFLYNTSMTKRQLCRLKRRERGLCRDCSNSVIVIGQKFCEACYERERIRNKKRREKLKETNLVEYVLKGTARNQLGDSSHWLLLNEKFIQQEGRCAYSGLPIEIGKDAEIDHILPKSRGGKNTIDNLQWVNERVNQMKAAMTEEEFLDMIYKIAQNRPHGRTNIHPELLDY